MVFFSILGFNIKNSQGPYHDVSNNYNDWIERYKNNDTWPKNTTFTEESFNHLQDIMIDYGQLDKKVAYNKLFYSIKK